MKRPAFEFVPGVFFKVLATALALVLLGWAGAAWLYGRLPVRDIIGSLICVLILAYMVHLWILYARDRGSEGKDKT